MPEGNWEHESITTDESFAWSSAVGLSAGCNRPVPPPSSSSCFLSPLPLFDVAPLSVFFTYLCRAAFLLKIQNPKSRFQ